MSCDYCEMKRDEIESLTATLKMKNDQLEAMMADKADWMNAATSLRAELAVTRGHLEAVAQMANRMAPEYKGMLDILVYISRIVRGSEIKKESE